MQNNEDLAELLRNALANAENEETEYWLREAMQFLEIETDPETDQ